MFRGDFGLVTLWLPICYGQAFLILYHRHALDVGIGEDVGFIDAWG